MTCSITPWDAQGVSTIEVSGADRRTALDDALRATLALAVQGDEQAGDVSDTRSAPLRGEGEDLSSLTADLMDDLLAQIAEYGTAARDVSVDGVVRREDGGLVAWGYLTVTAGSAPSVTPLHVHGAPDVDEADPARVMVRVALARDTLA